jgi:hypothetical protein
MNDIRRSLSKQAIFFKGIDYGNEFLIIDEIVAHSMKIFHRKVSCRVKNISRITFG